MFWIGGPPGCGKTHFLDYVIALQRRAGALDAQNMRRLVCGLELAGRITGTEIELFLLSVLAEQIGGDQRHRAICSARCAARLRSTSGWKPHGARESKR